MTEQKDLAEAVEEAIKKSPKKDVGLFLKLLGIAVVIIATGIGGSLMVRGSVQFKTAPKKLPEIHKPKLLENNSVIQEFKVPEGMEGKVKIETSNDGVIKKGVEIESKEK